MPGIKYKFESTHNSIARNNLNILEDMSPIIFQQNYIQNVYSIDCFGG